MGVVLGVVVAITIVATPVLMVIQLFSKDYIFRRLTGADDVLGVGLLAAPALLFAVMGIGIFLLIQYFAPAIDKPIAALKKERAHLELISVDMIGYNEEEQA